MHAAVTVCKCTERDPLDTRSIAGWQSQASATESRLRFRLSTAERHVPRFHFNVYDGYSAPDPEGVELVDLRAARKEAIVLAGSLIRDEGARLRPGEDWRMEVTDESGLLLCQLNFAVVEAPAIVKSGK